jgi:hypothetical protein
MAVVYFLFGFFCLHPSQFSQPDTVKQYNNRSIRSINFSKENDGPRSQNHPKKETGSTIHSVPIPVGVDTEMGNEINLASSIILSWVNEENSNPKKTSTRI